MTTADILAQVKGIAEEVDNYSTAGIRLTKLIEDLNMKICRELNVAQSKRSVAAAYERLLRSAQKNAPEKYHYQWIDSEGRQIVCDGYRAYRRINPISLPERPDGIDSLSYVSKVFDNAQAKCHKALELPDTKVLKAQITSKPRGIQRRTAQETSCNSVGVR